MTNYNLKPPATIPTFAWQEAKEKRNASISGCQEAQSGAMETVFAHAEKPQLASRQRPAIIDSPMTNATPIDITNIPELRQLVEEMRESNKPRLLKQDRETVALLVPLETTLKQQEQTTKEDIWAGYDAGKVRTALAQSAGTLAGVNRESLLTDIRSQRTQESTHHQF